MRTTLLISLFIIGLAVASGQSPAPIVVQAVNSPNASATSTSSKPAVAELADVSSVPDAVKQLEQIKAANDEVLAKQKAALERLDELQEAADQLRIFAKRG